MIIQFLAMDSNGKGVGKTGVFPWRKLLKPMGFKEQQRRSLPSRGTQMISVNFLHGIKQLDGA